MKWNNSTKTKQKCKYIFENNDPLKQIISIIENNHCGSFPELQWSDFSRDCISISYIQNSPLHPYIHIHIFLFICIHLYPYVLIKDKMAEKPKRVEMKMSIDDERVQEVAFSLHVSIGYYPLLSTIQCCLHFGDLLRAKY